MLIIYATPGGILTTSPQVARTLAEFEKRAVTLPQIIWAASDDWPPSGAPAIPAPCVIEGRV